MAENKPGLRDRASRAINGFAGKLTHLEIGRFQAAVLAILFACVWCVIGLLTGYLLSYLVVTWTSSGVDARSPASIIFNCAVLLCSGYGVIRGWRLYRDFSQSLDS